MDQSNIPVYWDRACAYLSGVDSVLEEIIKRVDNRLGSVLCRDKSQNAFQTLVRAIVGQQISVHASQVIWLRVLEVCGEISPDRVLKISYDSFDALRFAGLSGKKIIYIRGLAINFLEGILQPERWECLEDADIVRELCMVRGIGQWTAEMFLIFYMLRPDVYPLDDLGLLKAIKRYYLPEISFSSFEPSQEVCRANVQVIHGQHIARSCAVRETRKLKKSSAMPSKNLSGDIKRVVLDCAQELGVVWKPWRTVATWYLWGSLDPLPVAY